MLFAQFVVPILAKVTGWLFAFIALLAGAVSLILACWRWHWFEPFRLQRQWNKQSAQLLLGWLIGWLVCLALIILVEFGVGHDALFWATLGLNALILLSLFVILLLIGGALFVRAIIAIGIAGLIELSYYLAAFIAEWSPSADAATGLVLLYFSGLPTIAASWMFAFAFLISTGIDAILNQGEDAR